MKSVVLAKIKPLSVIKIGSGQPYYVTSDQILITVSLDQQRIENAFCHLVGAGIGVGLRLWAGVRIWGQDWSYGWGKSNVCSTLPSLSSLDPFSC